jgi:hypothetical protein
MMFFQLGFNTVKYIGDLIGGVGSAERDYIHMAGLV